MMCAVVYQLSKNGTNEELFQKGRSRTTTRRQRDMAGRAGIFSCVYALILFLSLTQFAESQPTLQENRKFLILKDFSWSRRFLIPIYANLCNQWKTKSIRHLGLVLHVRGFYATRINYYANSHSTFHQMRLYISGDIDVNPGPDECSVCNKRVARNHRAVNCDNCNMWCHIKCASIKPSKSSLIFRKRFIASTIQFSWINYTL